MLIGADNAGNIINRATVQLGLGTVSDPFASTDPKFVQMVEYLRSAVDVLNSEADWPNLRKEYTFTTVAGTNTYALPSDFHEMEDQSGWNRSSRLPLIGPLSSQEWQYLKARSVGTYISVVFRLGDGVIEINPGATVPDGIVVAFEYISANSFLAADGVTYKTTPTVASDVVLFDPDLVVSLLKLLWSEDRGYDTAALQKRYDEKLEHAIGKAMGAPTLNLAGNRSAVDRYIDNANLPLTGYGN